MEDVEKKILVEKLLLKFDLEKLYGEYRKSKDAKLLSLKQFKGELTFNLLVSFEESNQTISVVGFDLSNNGRTLKATRRAFKASVMGKDVDFPEVSESLQFP